MTNMETFYGTPGRANGVLIKIDRLVSRGIILVLIVKTPIFQGMVDGLYQATQHTQ